MRRYKHAKMAEEQRQEIKKLSNHKNLQKRSSRRLEAIILSSQGYTLEEISEIYKVDRDTLSKWIDQWEESGIKGLEKQAKEGKIEIYYFDASGFDLTPLARTRVVYLLDTAVKCDRNTMAEYQKSLVAN